MRACVNCGRGGNRIRDVVDGGSAGIGTDHERHGRIFEALERVRAPGDRWPLFAWYGVDSIGTARERGGKFERMGDRWEAYQSSLDPDLDEAPLLQWLQDEMLGDVSRQDRAEPERFFHKAVLEAAVRATPGVKDAWYDATAQSPVVCFEDGHAAPWSELSDGYHVFIALVADIARRAVMLNGFDGADAPARVEGVVLIDELDLHLHPRWQRVALPGLRDAFPRLQLVVTTHSTAGVEQRREPSGAAPRRRSSSGADVFVSGRDTNAILRDLMRTDDRDDEGVIALRRLHDAIDRATASRRIGSIENSWVAGEMPIPRSSEPRGLWRSRCGDWRSLAALEREPRRAGATRTCRCGSSVPGCSAKQDAGFITITADGTMLVSNALRPGARSALGLDRSLKVDGLHGAHERYLTWHRSRIFRTGENAS